MQQSSSLPKSMRHKQILDVAADNPDASIDDLAREVPSATPDLVERVLEEYGDPADDDVDTTAVGADGTELSTAETDSPDSNAAEADGVESETAGDGIEPETAASDGADSEEQPTDATTEATPAEQMDTENEATDGSAGADDQPVGATVTDDASDEADLADPADLTPTERETLRAIRANPEATQRALAAELGVSAATVSQRVNGIEGFEWSERASFVEGLFDTAPSATSSDAGGETAPSRSVTEATGETTPSGISSDGGPQTQSLTAGEPAVDPTVAETLDALETKLDALTEHRTDRTPFEDPELVSKIVHACMDAETISTDEELEIIETLLG